MDYGEGGTEYRALDFLDLQELCQEQLQREIAFMPFIGGSDFNRLVDMDMEQVQDISIHPLKKECEDGGGSLLNEDDLSFYPAKSQSKLSDWIDGRIYNQMPTAEKLPSPHTEKEENWDPVHLPVELSILVDPTNLELVTNVTFKSWKKLEKPEVLDEKPKEVELPKEIQEAIAPKPYHPSQDHDYWMKDAVYEESDSDDNDRSEIDAVEEKRKKRRVDVVEENNRKRRRMDVVKENDRERRAMAMVEELFNNEDEPVVDVWEIENFCEEKVPINKPIPEKLASHRRLTYRHQTRRSTRTAEKTAEKHRREQARKVSIAVHAVLKGNVQAVLKNGKGRNVRPYKNIRPKNSVETTPSQSDIEEWYSQPVRPTYTKITKKKKTSKGRIDHSESERHRREVLRTNFDCLSRLIPMKYMIGEKASSQISKQKILNGAKLYIRVLLAAKRSYKKVYRKNQILKEKLQKRISSKLLKCVKKQK